MLPTWSQYHRENKDSMSMNEMIRQYNFMMDLEYMAGNNYGFLLQENLDYLLQEDGSRIFWN